MARALISVSDKTGVVDFARALVSRQYDIVSTGGTARALEAAGLPVTGVSTVTGFPEMLDGRVKTLHPMVHGGILARRHREDDRQALARHAITPIDIVAVNLYPFVQTAADPAVSFDALLEEIDIGGPTLVRAAAKNFRDVLVVVDPGDYGSVVEALDGSGAAAGSGEAFRFGLARKAFAHTAAYDTAIATALEAVTWQDGAAVRGPADAFPSRLTVSMTKARDLRYGENPHQRAAWYVTAEGGPDASRVLQGKPLSFTNLLDLDAAVRIAAEFDEPAAAVIKHTNPCGTAVGPTIADAYLRAREADALAAFGGIVGLNRPLDESVAARLVETFIEVVAAPAVTPEARPLLAARKNLRVIEVVPPGTDAPGHELRSVVGGLLVQERDAVREARGAWSTGADAERRVVTRRAPSAEEWAALRFAWRVSAHVKSNAVLFTTATETVAIGAGQTSRVDAVRVARLKAGERSLAGTVAASDAFFPFPDGLEAVAEAGATAVVQPGGSVRDDEVIAAADARGIAMVFTGRRHFRH